MSDLRTASTTFGAIANGVLTDAAAALPTLEGLFPGSTEASLAEAQKRLDDLVAFIENTIAGWSEAVAQASPSVPE